MSIALIRRLWQRAFLDRRPSTSLGLFRIAVAITVGCHLIPSLLQLQDNYLSTAFKEKNGSFFPIWALQLVEASPDWVVRAWVAVFVASWASFLVGFMSQASALLMTLACYYFYAMNSLHIGTLSFDILLVTLSLVWITGYHGDWLSVDSLLRGHPDAHKRPRPFFVQRLLQLQLTWTFWYTALSKITAEGNWFTDNPYYYLMHYPPLGVVREFPLRGFLAQRPDLCLLISHGLPLFEFILPWLWWIPRTRSLGVALGVGFQILLFVTLHVPTIFFFLFPPMMLLFIPPERIVAWIDARRAARAARPWPILLYDGRCGFCLASVDRLRILDLFAAIKPVNYHEVEELTALHPSLSRQRCHSRMQLVEPDGRLSEGFLAFRRISLRLPLLWPLVPLVYVPGAVWAGQRVYDWIASHRHLFHSSRQCSTNQCGVETPSEGDSSSNA
ncbi:MAG: DUF393 domain-containing protein [Candidatus Omnitrophica bacterium]|nr:DUF393 domain-containing protein [Candidatus Omnitrophota bacterium]